MNNVAYHLLHFAQSQPDQIAVAEPAGRKNGKRIYKTITFRELNEDSDRIAHALREMGVTRGTRIALLVRPGIDFVSAVFGCLKSGAVMILIDPGMGKGNLFTCLEQAKPEGFFAISVVQAVWRFMRVRFPLAEHNLTVGRRWFWGGPTLAGIRKKAYPGAFMDEVSREDPAAIIFTTGSTGPPKGVLYTHQTFNAQVAQISEQYGISPGQTDLPGFPMFGLFNCAMGSTAVIPDMDPSRPASVDPRNILEAVRDWNVSQSFGSPAIWKTVSRWCHEKGERLEQVRMILSAGAPVQEPVLRSVKAIIHPEGEIHTPYGATEALPVATISATEVLNETAAKSREGRGVCVGRRFSGITWKVIRITDGPIPTLDKIEELPAGEIGELIVSGPQVTREYVTYTEINALAKIHDAASIPLPRRGGCAADGVVFPSSGGVSEGRGDDSPPSEGCPKGGVVNSPPSEGWLRSSRGGQGCAHGDADHPASSGGTPPEEGNYHPVGFAATPPEEGNFTVWHRMGDVGYLDAQDRFWFCGRMAHRVEAETGTFFSIPTEAIFNAHPEIVRSALVGVRVTENGVKKTLPVIVVEPKDAAVCRDVLRQKKMREELLSLAATNDLTREIRTFLFHPSFPVDIRHNAKIFREKLAVWAEKNR